jgi:hypothetical protein
LIKINNVYTIKNIFVGVPHLATYVFLNFQNKPGLGAGIDPGMAFTPFSSKLLDETKIETKTFRSRVEFSNHYITPILIQFLR